MFMRCFPHISMNDDTSRCQWRRQQQSNVAENSNLFKSANDSDGLWELKCHPVMSHWRSRWSHGVLDTQLRSADTDSGTRHLHCRSPLQSKLRGWLWRHRLESPHHQREARGSRTVRVSNQHRAKNEIEYQSDGERWVKWPWCSCPQHAPRSHPRTLSHRMICVALEFHTQIISLFISLRRTKPKTFGILNFRLICTFPFPAKIAYLLCSASVVVVTAIRRRRVEHNTFNFFSHL